MIDVAILAAKEAGKILLEKALNRHDKIYKSGGELVTEVDIKAEQKIREIIKREFPSHNILGEEGGKIGTSVKYLWIVDPLDGTVNYSRGIFPYGVSIAIAENGKVTAGVVYNPVTEELFTAEKGKGSTINGKNVTVSKVSDLSKGIIYVSPLYLAEAVVRPLFRKVKNLRVSTSTAYEICLVGCGRAEGYIKITAHPWGFAAAALFVEEAGGKVTNLDGTAWGIKSTQLLCSNGLVHSKILNTLERQLNEKNQDKS